MVAWECHGVAHCVSGAAAVAHELASDCADVLLLQEHTKMSDARSFPSHQKGADVLMHRKTKTLRCLMQSTDGRL